MLIPILPIKLSRLILIAPPLKRNTIARPSRVPIIKINDTQTKHPAKHLRKNIKMMDSTTERTKARISHLQF